jgi:AcrR family transcriptional regulator
MELVRTEPRIALRERKKLATHARLLEEARRLLAAHGYRGTSVERIAEAAQVAPATFFNYFGCKDQLVAELAAEWIDRLREPFDVAAREVGDVRARLDRAFAASVPLVLEARERYGPLLLRVVRGPLGERLRSTYSRLIAEGQLRGELRSDVDAAFLAELSGAAHVAALVNWLHDPRFPLDARMCQAAAVIAGGLRPDSEPENPRRDP